MKLLANSALCLGAVCVSAVCASQEVIQTPQEELDAKWGHDVCLFFHAETGILRCVLSVCQFLAYET